MKKLLFVLITLSVLFCMGCDYTPTADDKVTQKQEAMQNEAVAEVGLPGITNYTELKLDRYLYELRDSKIATYTYIPDMQGRLWHLCDSIGFGLPYATQFSNPQKRIYNSAGWYTMPQAEPNGLFMPSAAEGTWVLCSNPSKKMGIDPIYVEPRIVSSPFKLRAEGEYQLTSK